MTFQLTQLLSFSSCLSMFSGGCKSVRPKSSSVDGGSLHSGPKSELAKFYRLQLQPTPTLAKTSTPSDSNSSSIPTPQPCSSVQHVGLFRVHDRRLRGKRRERGNQGVEIRGASRPLTPKLSGRGRFGFKGTRSALTFTF